MIFRVSQIGIKADKQTCSQKLHDDGDCGLVRINTFFPPKDREMRAPHPINISKASQGCV